MQLSALCVYIRWMHVACIIAAPPPGRAFRDSSKFLTAHVRETMHIFIRACGEGLLLQPAAHRIQLVFDRQARARRAIFAFIYTAKENLLLGKLVDEQLLNKQRAERCLRCSRCERGNLGVRTEKVQA